MKLISNNKTSVTTIIPTPHTTIIPMSVTKSFLLCKPLPCKAAAETALHPLIWCSSS